MINCGKMSKEECIEAARRQIKKQMDGEEGERRYREDVASARARQNINFGQCPNCNSKLAYNSANGSCFCWDCGYETPW